MARIKLELPQKFLFETQLTIAIGYINYGGHLGNDSALTLMHEARLQMLQSFGFSELDIAGKGLLQTDAAVIYKAQVFWGETVRAEVGIADISRYGCDLYYRFSRNENEVLLGKTGLVFFDYATNQKTRIPQAFLNAVGQTEGV